MLVLRPPGLIGNQNRAPAQLLKKQSFLQKDVVESLGRGDVTQIDVDSAGLCKGLPVKDDIKLKLFSKAADKALKITAVR